MNIEVAQYQEITEVFPQHKKNTAPKELVAQHNGEKGLSNVWRREPQQHWKQYSFHRSDSVILCHTTPKLTCA